MSVTTAQTTHALRVANDLHAVLESLNSLDEGMAVQAPGTAYQSTVDALIAVLAHVYGQAGAHLIYDATVRTGKSPSRQAALLTSSLAELTQGQVSAAIEGVTLAQDLPTQWAVTALTHPAVRDFREACTDCLAQSRDAMVSARITGSTGATSGRIGTDGREHSATVSRVLATVR